VITPGVFTGVGSLPFTSAKEAVEYVFQAYEIPFLPQLPQRSLQEHMVYQFLEDFPGFVLTPSQAFIDVEKFNPENLLNKKFSFSFYKALPLFIKKADSVPLIKLQITSPYTIANTLLCSDKQLLSDHPPLCAYLNEFLYYKVSVLLEKFRHQTLLVFFDEPMLTHRNSQEVLTVLNPLVRKLKNPTRFFGVHSCNQWSQKLFQDIFQSEFDMVNFDMKEVGEAIFEDLPSLFQFLKRGWIMWGGVGDDFIERLKNKDLKRKEVFTILNRSLFSLACGTGKLSLEMEKQGVESLKKITKELKREIKVS